MSTRTKNVAALDQECSFGKGGVAAGPATCTASGRLDPKVWGAGNGIRTHVFDSHEINWYWIRDVVVATAGALCPLTRHGGLNGVGRGACRETSIVSSMSKCPTTLLRSALSHRSCCWSFVTTMLCKCTVWTCDGRYAAGTFCR